MDYSGLSYEEIIAMKNTAEMECIMLQECAIDGLVMLGERGRFSHRMCRAKMIIKDCNLELKRRKS